MKWEEIIPHCEIIHLILWISQKDALLPPSCAHSLPTKCGVSHTGLKNQWAPSVAGASLTLSTVCLANCRAVWVLSSSCCGLELPTSLSTETGLLLFASSDHCWQWDWALSGCRERHNRLQFPNSHQESHSKINECCDVCWLHARPSKTWANGCKLISRDVEGFVEVFGWSFFFLLFIQAVLKNITRWMSLKKVFCIHLVCIKHETLYCICVLGQFRGNLTQDG